MAILLMSDECEQSGWFECLFHTRAEVEGLYQTLSEYASSNGLIISKISKSKLRKTKKSLRKHIKAFFFLSFSIVFASFSRASDKITPK